MMLCFELSMPGVGSWNGRWSGEGQLYAVTRNVGKSALSIVAGSPYHYRWSDGWAAMIRVSQVNGSQARTIRRQSKGFCGYEWMVDSILARGKILADHELPKTEKASAA